MRLDSRSGGLLSVAMLVGALLLASCSTPAPPESTTSASEAKPSGSLNINVTWRYGGVVDPTTIASAQFHAMGAAVLDSLTELDPKGGVRPGLAERWEISSDGKAHTYYLRKGVKFHDGSDLTAADVKFSLDRLVATDSTNSLAGSVRSQIASVAQKDDYTVVINLKQPQFELVDGFATLGSTAAVVPKKYIEEKGVDYFRSHPMGSGPWKVTSFQQEVRMELEAVENHWRAAPKFKNINLLNVTEESTKVAMLKTGELDLSEVSPDSAPGLKAAGLRVLTHDGGAEYFAYLFYDIDRPEKWALGDVRVRKALSLATNRQELADKLYSGYAEPAVLYMAPKSAAFFDSTVLKPDPFDPEGAKKLLAEAGYPNGFNMRILNSGAGGIVGQLNQAMAGQWRKAGVNVELTPVEYATAITLWRPKPRPEAYDTAWGWISGAATFQFEMVANTYHSVPTSAKFAADPRMDTLIEKAQVATDPVEKKKLQLEATLLIKSLYPVLPVIKVKTVYAVGPKVGEFAPTQGTSGFAASFETLSHAK